MKIFLAGPMRASLHTKDFVDQSYRHRLRKKVWDTFPDATIFDPYLKCGEDKSNTLTDEQQREVFLREIEIAKASDLVVAYLSEVSMGTAIEIWSAYHAGSKVIVISPLIHNWTVKFICHHHFHTLEEFEVVDLKQLF